MAEGPETQLPNSSSDQPPSQDFFNDQTQIPPSNGSKSPNGNIPSPPLMYHGTFPPQQDQEPINHGPGLYAVPVHPFTQQPIVGVPPNYLIPFTYNLPAQRNNSTGIREVGGEQGQPVGPPVQQQQQRQVVEREVVVWRFEINLPLDFWLIIKLVGAVLLLSRDGSRQRLIFLSFLAVLAYLYRVGTLAPVVRRLSRRMRRAVGPPHRPPRAALRVNNLPADVAHGDENAGGENENRANENEHGGEAGQVEAGNRLWRIVKEIQIIVVGFVTSLIPGFHDD